MNDAFPQLLSPLEIGSCQIRNRIVFTGHATNLARHGYPSDELVAYQRARARGGAGLVVTQVSAVHQSGWHSELSLRIYDDNSIPHYRRVAQAVHEQGGRVFGQLFHPGREVHNDEQGLLPVSFAPSALPTDRYANIPRAMSTDFVEHMISCFGDGARRFQEAGYDGAEILGTQGYLIALFLNPKTNQRTDRFGGDLEARLQIVHDIVADVRNKAPGLALGLRISGDELDPAGLSQEDAVEACATLTASLDYISVVGGTSATLGGAVHIVPPMAYEAGYLRQVGGAIRARSACPVMLTGRINTPQVAEQIIVSGQADACGMTRAMICDPAMPSKLVRGALQDVRACIGCDQACIGHFHAGYPISCIQHPETGRELRYENLSEAAPARRIAVIGGGPAGMKAAAVAAARGHEVTLFERQPRLGGQALLASMLPGREEFGGIVTNLAHEVAQAGVTVETGTEVDVELLRELGADAVVLATGARPYRPPIEGEDEAHVVDAWQVLQGEVNVGASVVIADWRRDWVGMGIAEKLARDGCSVRLYVNGHFAGENLPQYVRDQKLGDLHKLGVQMIPMVKVFGADADNVYFEHMSAREAVIAEDVDTLVLALGHSSDDALSDTLREAGMEVHVIGDAATARTAEEAVYEGLDVASRL